jgi:hypothetical protein
MMIAMRHPQHGYMHVHGEAEAKQHEVKGWERLETDKDGNYETGHSKPAEETVVVPARMASVAVEQKRGRPRKEQDFI